MPADVMSADAMSVGTADLAAMARLQRRVQEGLIEMVGSSVPLRCTVALPVMQTAHSDAYQGDTTS
jgi:hypothetical protein